jgi:hypothetical protein
MTGPYSTPVQERQIKKFFFFLLFRNLVGEMRFAYLLFLSLSLHYGFVVAPPPSRPPQDYQDGGPANPKTAKVTFFLETGFCVLPVMPGGLDS